jgi:alkanesulfonate monooxygenase SsuD/methylene tetrahydromethanopterin reductase-like flavin-dependent oxidoreductase (luciferase family)
MRVGMAATFQNWGGELGDTEVYQRELKLAKMAEPLGFESIWTVEHHFTGYQMVPDPMQFLSYMAGTSETLGVGTMVVVLPWHRDVVRVAEEVIMLDHYTQGRVILGLGRGAGKVEFDGFGLDMSDSRPTFIEQTELLTKALETGIAEYDGQYVQQPRAELRPRPFKSFKGRLYCGSLSPESLDIMARLGLGMLITPVKDWALVAPELIEYRQRYQQYHGADPVPTIGCGWVMCHEDEERAYELAQRYIKEYWKNVLGHYGMDKPKNFEGKKGYENYLEGAKVQAAMDPDVIAENFMKLHLWGTPEQIYEKVMTIRSHIGNTGLNCVFRYADMPYDEAERNIKLFAKEVLPEIKKIPDPDQFGATGDAQVARQGAAQTA